MKIKNKKFFWKKPPDFWSVKSVNVSILTNSQKRTPNGKAALKKLNF